MYKVEYDNKIIYIGKTDSNLNNRIKQHIRNKKFDNYKNYKVYCHKYSNNFETKYMEELLINKYQPIFNIVGNNGINANIEFEEPNWITYEEYLNLCKENKERQKNINKSLKVELCNANIEEALKILGNNIKRARLRRNISSAELAKNCDISRSTLVSIEKGSPSVAMGHYANIIGSLGLINDFTVVCSDFDYILKHGENINQKRARKNKYIEI